MKWMNLFFVLLSTICMAQAQTPNRGEDMKTLNLSDEQRIALDEEKDIMRSNMKAIKSSELSIEEKRSAARELKSEFDETVRQILREEQYEKWTEQRKERKGKRLRRDANVDLQLTEEQEAQMKEIRDRWKAELEANRNADISTAEKRENMKEMKLAMDEEVRAVLDDEQYENWKEHRRQRHQKRS